MRIRLVAQQDLINPMFHRGREHIERLRYLSNKGGRPDKHPVGDMPIRLSVCGCVEFIPKLRSKEIIAYTIDFHLVTACGNVLEQ